MVLSTLLLLCQYLCWRSISPYGIIYIVITVSVPIVITVVDGVLVPMVLSTLLLLCQYLCWRSISPYGIIYIVITVSVPLLTEY